MCKIKIVDAPCGYGKTNSAIELMKKNHGQKYVYVTPYLKEIDRIKHKTNRRFFDPKNWGTKQSSLHILLQQGKNIATTHALFQSSTDVTRTLIESQEYVLILDEVMNVIQETDISKDDLNIILSQNLAHISDEYYLIWDNKDYNGEYNTIKAMSLNKTLVVIDEKVLLWKFPVDMFDCFQEVYILTYMFDAQIQKYYYDIHNKEYEYYTVSEDMKKFVYVGNEPKEYHEFKKFVKSNVNLYSGKYNIIGNGKYSMSYSWYGKEENELLYKTLQKNIENYFRTTCKTQANNNMWTCFKKNRDILKGKGYARGFVPCNARATNEYRHKESVTYPLNRFIKPYFKRFFSQYGISLNDDKVALSDLIQFIWRSQIRDGKPINLYLPSERTRKLFEEWLET